MLQQPETKQVSIIADDPTSPLKSPSNRRASRIPRLSVSVKNQPQLQAPLFSIPGVTIATDEESTEFINRTTSLVSPRSPNAEDSSTIDRVNTPGKLRAFFDEVKRSRSAGDNVSVPQKYRDMLAEDRAKNSAPPSIQHSKSLTHSDTFTTVASPAGTHRRTSTLPSSFNNATARRKTTIQKPIHEFDNETNEGHVLDMSVLSKTYPGRRKGSFNPRMVIPKIEGSNLDEIEDVSSTWNDSGSLPRTTKKSVQMTVNEEKEILEKKPIDQKKNTTMRAGEFAKQKAKDIDATGEVEEQEIERPPTPEGMKRCEYCERCFNEDRVEKHMNVCQQNPEKKKRKVFDGTTIRTKGTEFEGKISKSSKAPAKPVKKANWREQHEQFINAIKAAKA